jgi:hypothetical protein
MRFLVLKLWEAFSLVKSMLHVLIEQVPEKLGTRFIKEKDLLYLFTLVFFIISCNKRLFLLR